MARFFGKVGYGESVETPPGSGDWIMQISERDYQGDVVRNTVQLQAGDKVNNDISLGNSIRIVADDYAIVNIPKMKYVIWAGVHWIVTSVEIQHPRLILSLGGVYNGPKA